MPITMDQLAKECGFSKATVSRALNDDPRVKEATRKLIKELATRHNYRPHAVASNLARRQTRIIGLLIPRAPRNAADPFFLEFFHGVNETLFHSGYSVLMPPVPVQRELEAIEQMLHQHRVDGVILTEPRNNDPRIAVMQESDVPFVFLGRAGKRSLPEPTAEKLTVERPVFWVDGANEQGAFDAVRHLIQLGHRKVAVVAGETDLTSNRDRLKGWRRALREAGVEPKPEWVIHGDYTREGSLDAVCAWLEENGDGGCTAIFACNDAMAIGAIQALKRRQYRIPDEMAIVGFDGIEASTYVEPALTTVQQPIFELGRTVAHQLLRLLQGKNPVETQITLPLQLIVRESSRPPAR